MDTDLVAYLDESRKPMRNPATRRVDDHGRHNYVVAAVVILDGESADISRDLKRIRARVGYRLHYRELRSLHRRIEVIEAIKDIDGWDGYLFETARALPDANFTEHHVRAKTMEAVFTRLSSEGVMKAVLETRADLKKGFNLDTKDHQVLNRLKLQEAVPYNFQIRHEGKAQTLLQLPDLLAGARSDWLCYRDHDIYARVAHRVIQIHPVFPRQKS